MNKHYICSVDLDISCTDESLQSRIVSSCPALLFLLSLRWDQLDDLYHFVSVNDMVHIFRDLSLPVF